MSKMSENPKITMQVISYQYALIGKHKLHTTKEFEEAI